MSNARDKKRRQTLKGLLAGAVAFAVYPFASIATSYLGYSKRKGGGKAQIKLEDLNTATRSKHIEIAEEPVIVIHSADDKVRAFTASCTHLGCIVSYRPQEPGFYCKCHKGKFDGNGVNVPGSKPKSPLTELPVVVEGDLITISLKPQA
jgi:Rieske Fe-S protein